MRVSEIIRITRGRLLCGDARTDIDLSRISTDSRTIRKGGFFIALKGPNFDGNDFVEAVLEKGAIGAIVSNCKNGDSPHLRVNGPGTVPIFIQVKDTARALQAIAHYHRMRFKIPVIAVTGSNGKTTTKEMIWSVLSTRYNVLKNDGTENNHIGVPRTLLRLNAKHDMCVLELGTNHYGELRLLGSISRPGTVVMTNIGPSHLESLKVLGGVFKAKKEILEYLTEGGTLILNGDDPHLLRIKSKRFKIIRFGFGESNDFRASQAEVGKNSIRFSVNGGSPFKLNILGEHNIYNALAAIATASEFGIPHKSIQTAFLRYRPGPMRLNLVRVRGIDIINDSYNSNPLSMEGALNVLKRYPARKRWVVSGDMLELGADGRYFHEALGEAIADRAVDGLLTLGRLSSHAHSRALACGMDRSAALHCKTHNQIASALRRCVKKGDVILIKGSRGMKMERVIEKLRDERQ